MRSLFRLTIFSGRAQHVNCACKPHRVKCPICIATVILNDLEKPRPFTFPILGAWMSATKLCQANCRPNLIFQGLRESQ